MRDTCSMRSVKACPILRLSVRQGAWIRDFDNSHVRQYQYDLVTITCPQSVQATDTAISPGSSPTDSATRSFPSQLGQRSRNARSRASNSARSSPSRPAHAGTHSPMVGYSATSARNAAREGQASTSHGVRRTARALFDGHLGGIDGNQYREM
jgi:hypothetical protein